MRRDEMENSNKRSRETYYERREIDTNRKKFSESSQYYRTVVKKGPCKEIAEEQNYRKEKFKHPSDHSFKKLEMSKRHASPETNRHERVHRNSPIESVFSGSRNTDYRKEKFKHPSDHSFKKQEMSKRHASPVTNRHERVHRNSPIESVVSGSRNTDRSSSSRASSDKKNRHKHKCNKHKEKRESFEQLSHKSPVELVVSGSRNTDRSSRASSDKKNRHKHTCKKHKERRKSFEELLCQKQRIESELNAEAAIQSKEEPRKKRNRSQDRHEGTETSKRIKQEPMSDDENDRLRRGNHRSGHWRRNGDNESRSTADNAEWGDADYSRSMTPDKEKEKPSCFASEVQLQSIVTSESESERSFDRNRNPCATAVEQIQLTHTTKSPKPDIKDLERLDFERDCLILGIDQEEIDAVL